MLNGTFPELLAGDAPLILFGRPGTTFGLQWAGTTATLSAMSRIGRRLSKNSDEAFPAWQGMQYFVSMFSGQADLRHVDNDRFGPHRWTTVRDVLAAHLARGTESRGR